ncbi:uncharacterized protein I303_108575 [Kwoniella dejecticola CBS 10117]|uniref:Zn(2)-C6 fungal-type domain-containing protein n=1 Tax=Kwoniella dejecticola CBS 10117 TaxID=1296121 RepID=A0A1A5ZX06_9TREE|nr:uncharacterized protein I303_07099 [Kwoniella dejecticola CBS 10117]OBR82340.1 hypothetical protein I303_07099 [Kwoniella dejecticola CBS 10117]
MSAIPSTSLAPMEARAKRTHARRSCDVCKVRKTRCELPDLDVPSGPTPLPTDKACHRCRVLALPCIVDDSGKKSRKRPRDDAKQETSAGIDENGHQKEDTPKRKATKPKSASSSSASKLHKGLTRRQSDLNHSLDVLHGISPLAQQPQASHPLQPASLDEASRIQPEAPSFDQNEVFDQSKSMKLHGRPAELACAMLRVAYGKIGVKRKPHIDDDDVNLNDLVNRGLKARLQPGFTQLKTYHPHLETLEDIYKRYDETPDAPTKLLLSLVIYLVSLSLPAEEQIQHVRTTLTPYISHLRDRALLYQTRSFIALQAFELLSVHAPLGILPLEATSLKDLGVARGIGVASRYLMGILEFEKLIDQVMNGPGPVFAFECADFWLWAALIADQTAMTFEDLKPIRPIDLSQARTITEDFMNYDERSRLWLDGLNRGDAAILVGRLSVCDRLARVEEVLDTMHRLRVALDISVGNTTFDPVREILNEFENFERRMEAIDARHDTIMAALSEQSRGVESGWLSYRSIRRRYETNKVYVTGLRMLIATHYLSGSIHSYPDVPPFLTPTQGVDYAISRSYHPVDIVRFITDTTTRKPAVEAVWDWGRKRGINTEASLVACAELGQNLVGAVRDGAYAPTVPLHDIIMIANEAAKVLIEMEAGTIQILRSSNMIDKAFRPRSWLVVMNQVSQTFRSIGMLAPSDDLGGDTIANGCSNLIGSMVRSAEDWTKSLEKEIPRGVDTPDTKHHSDDRQDSPNVPPYLENTVMGENGNGNGNGNGSEMRYGHHHHQDQGEDTTLHESLRQSAGGIPSGHHPHQYMDSSDRWMASSSASSQSHGHGSGAGPSQQQNSHLHPPQQLPPPPPAHQQHQEYTHHHTYINNGEHLPPPPQSGPYPNTQLDQLLSEMFCYNLPSQPTNAGQYRSTEQAIGHHHQIQPSWPQDMRSQ